MNMQKKDMSAKGQLALIGLIIIVLIIASLLYYLNKNKKINLNFSQKEIIQVENNAFGSLVSEQINEEGQFNEAAGVAGRGGGGSATAPVANSANTAESKVLMPAPDITNYNYIYQGDKFTINEEQMAVFKRIKDKNVGQQMAGLISGINTGLIDLNKFSQTTISNLNIIEDKNYGYSIYFDITNSAVSLNAYWEKWPRPEAECVNSDPQVNQKCYEELRLKISDVPADEELIAIANAFIKDYEINIKNYGPGQVQADWRQYYDAAANKETAYIPDTIQVIYPLIINGQTVSDEAGNPYGITVDINIRYKKVYGLRGITPQDYESSNYAVETDSQKIINLALKGEVYSNWVNPYASKTVEVELGTPTLGLVVRWQYNYTKGDSTELYVPAYIFPVLNEPESYFYRKNIVVPLPIDIIEEIEKRNNDIIGLPRPEPLIMEDSVKIDEVNNNE